MLIPMRQYSWVFKTDNDIDYLVKFEKANHHFTDFLPFLNIFELSIELQNEVQLSPLDLRIEKTIIEVIRKLFDDNTNSLLYICDNLDGRHFVRARKFNNWFLRHNDGTFEKYDEKVIVKNDADDILSYMPISLILHTQNPYKSHILSIFNTQIDTYNK